MLKKILIFIVVTSLPCLTQWRWINPTTNNLSINEIKFYKNFITLSGENGNVLLSTDNGKSWKNFSDFGVSSVIETHFLNIDTGYILKLNREGYIGEGINISTEFKITTNKGNSWGELQFTQEPGFIQDVCFHNNNIWLSFLSGAGCIWFGNVLYHSSDYGNSWNEIEARELGYCNNMIAINESTILAQSNYVRISFDKFLVKSTNYGLTWDYKHNLGFNSLNDLKIISNEFIIGGGYGGIIVKSQDQGDTWETSFLPDGVEVIDITGTVNNLLALTKSAGKKILYRSTDQGKNWIKVFEPDTIFNTVSYKSNSEFWLGGQTGKILRSTNSGISWNKFNYMYDQNFNAVGFISKSKGYIVGDKGTILKTTNSGKSWNSINSPTDSNLIDIAFFPQDNSGFLVSSDGKIFKLVDLGSSWINVYNDPSIKVKKVSFITKEQILAVGESNLVLLSTNSGETWAIANKNIDVYGECINISIPAPDCIYLGYENIIYRSTDTAKTWNKFYEGMHKILSFDFPSRNNGYVFYLLYSNYSNIILTQKTTDGGLNWNWSNRMIIFPGHKVSNFKSVFINDSTGYLIGSILISTTNCGNNWNINYNINGNDIYIDRDLNGWIVGNAGAIISNVKFDEVILPPFYEIKEYKLHQNYPNPFNTGTLIEYEILNDGHVILKVIDILGKEVDKLVDRFQPAGRHSVFWQPKDLPSGIYFYSLQSNNNFLTRKMCLIK